LCRRGRPPEAQTSAVRQEQSVRVLWPSGKLDSYFRTTTILPWSSQPNDIAYSRTARRDLEQVRRLGHERLPICIIKTHLRLTGNRDHARAASPPDLPVEAVRVAAGAGYLLALAGEIVTMPGLPQRPAAY
jgi:formyltetrahydrofolate synthetase